MTPSQAAQEKPTSPRERLSALIDEVNAIPVTMGHGAIPRIAVIEAIETARREASAATPSLDVERLARAIQADIARRRPLEAGQPLTAWSEVMRTAIFIRDHYEGDGR